MYNYTFKDVTFRTKISGPLKLPWFNGTCPLVVVVEA